jgi:cytochrome c oxidase subunit 4
MGGSHADIRKHVRSYLMVFGALALLTVLTVTASYIQVSTAAHVTIALVIATIKASLVAAVFMHLKWERGASIWWTLFFCAVFFAVLMLLPSLTAFELPPQAEMRMWD